MRPGVLLAVFAALALSAGSAGEASRLTDAEAPAEQRRTAEERAKAAERRREAGRMRMVDEVDRAWERPRIFDGRPGPVPETPSRIPALARKLAEIQVPAVSFSSVDLGRVAQILTALAEEHDPATEGPRGVNVVLIDPANRSPEITLALRNLPLKRILDFVTEAAGYRYEIQEDAVVLKPGGETSALDTAFFPVARSTVIRMTGGGAAAPRPTPPEVAAPPAADGGAGGEAGLLRAFLQSAGVAFDTVPGASLAYDGSAMIVTQTARNLERIRTILNRYTDVRQVEIEAKFLEVQEGALEELGITWEVGRRGGARRDPQTGAPMLDRQGRPVATSDQAYTTRGVNRTLSEAFTGSANGNAIVIDGEPVASTAPPRLPGAAALAGEASGLASFAGIVGDFDVSALLRLLAQKSGSDLLSAPRVTVLSGNQATITVAQELRYPQSYGEIQSQVGMGRTAADGGGGAAGVTITAGTPQDFTSRNVGVELKVTPTVEEDDYSISLELAPRVTEFEGFVEYGGPSVAVAGGRTVTVPAGFHQPIFSVREVTTRVMLWDGATLVMGGLTREDVKTVHDKVPVLGDIPLLGKAFRSKGRSSQKRNLLIFVTASLVSPGGSLKKQDLPGAPAGALFRHPTPVTPEKAESRGEPEP